MERAEMTHEAIANLAEILLTPDSYVFLEVPPPVEDGAFASFVLGRSANRLSFRLWHRDHATLLEITYQLFGRVTFLERDVEALCPAPLDRGDELFLSSHGASSVRALASSLVSGVIDSDEVQVLMDGAD